MYTMDNKSTIRNVADLGSSVLLDINDGDRMLFARLHDNSTMKISGSKCSLEALIGSPFGAIFEMQRGKLVRVTPSVSSGNGSIVDEKNEDENYDERERDNRNLIDTNTAQTLSSGEIERMRKDGLSGKEIIDALIANSSSFEGKTAFSQEKYMRKKQKKYAPRVILRRPSAKSICEAYFAKDPRKIGMDTLALMLSLSNVGANSDVLVVDSLGGLITAAVAERVGGHGSICSTYYTSKRPPIDMVRLLNIDELTANRYSLTPIPAFNVLRASVGAVLAARKRLADISVSPKDKRDGLEDENTVKSIDSDHQNRLVVSVPEADTVETLGDDISQRNGAEGVPSNAFEGKDRDINEDSPYCSGSALTVLEAQNVMLDGNIGYGEGKAKGPKPGKEASDADIDRWASQGFTSLLVAAPELDPWLVAEKLLPLLSSSSPFVIYHSYQQPLAECMHRLQVNCMAVSLQLIEPWSREYQVLPGRTHPHMQLSATGGYILSGTFIA